MRFPRQIEPFFQGKGTSLRVFKSGPGTCAALARRLKDHGRHVVVVVPSARELERVSGLLELFGGAGDWLFLGRHPAGEPRAFDWSSRWSFLHSLTTGHGPVGAVVTADNYLCKWPPPEVLDDCTLTLRRGEDLSTEILLEQAVGWGYRRVNMVTAPGELAVRGDILDIFVSGSSMPLRLEFFGDTLEGIRLFDLSTQRSRADLDEALILPALPAVMEGKWPVEALENWESLRKSAEIGDPLLHHLQARAGERDGAVLPGMFYKNAANLEDHLPKGAVHLFLFGASLRQALEEADWAWSEYLEKEASEKGSKWPARLVRRGDSAVRRHWSEQRQIMFEELAVGVEREGLDLPEKEYASFEELFWKPESRRRPWTALMDALRDWKRSKSFTCLSFRSNAARNRFLGLAENEELDIALEYGPDSHGLAAGISPLRTGVELQWAQVMVLGEDVLQPTKGERRRRDTAFKGLSGYEDLSEGELLVHRDYGLARFVDLRNVKLGKVGHDCLLLLFDGDDKLYLPVDRLNLVQRYKGPDGAALALDKLGGTRWAKTRDRVRKAVEKIARDLVEMYAHRKIAKGYAFGPADDLFLEFEAGFGFDATPDQEQAISDVFRDMEKTEPMDRLICGDVGFGKTEVALRAAFRAASDGKQVALLCPTTVLAEQHFQTFQNRMDPFPVRVGMLSRFVLASRQKKVLAAAKSGEIDILIGTHRLLSKDVELPGLGLLVLDEEQRFGVRHKERLKELRKNVDVLSLTATPIPRTLQLSLSGIRSLSVIETPPPDRKAVQTLLMEKDKKHLKIVLERELSREGQVFWVHNRVKSLEASAELVRELVPDARVGMAHGQMPEKQLEEAMRAFWHGEIDVLVCTAIIESGLDFPRANTLVVDNAHMFGLGQLYQLRGRVGRSDRQAYAYFLAPSEERLQPQARKRLQVMMELDYLGAGFRVAMEDLRLRGAGNILGEAQSGQIAKVGLDLFLEMLEEEVLRLKGEERVRETDPELSFTFEARLPETWITDPRERLRYYRVLSEAKDAPRLEELEMELKDRFGPLPEEAARFLGVLALKQVLAWLQAARCELHAGRAAVTWGEGVSRVEPEALLGWVEDHGDRARLTPPARLEVRFADHESIRVALEDLAAELSALGPPKETKAAE